MRKSCALVQLLGFGIAGAAMAAPEFPRLLSDWPGGTIYPWWAAAYVVLGTAVSVMSLAVPDDHPVLVVRAAVTVLVLAGQVAGLGLVAVKHWLPSFGMGGAYAGEPDQLARLAWVVGVAGIVAALAAVGQLVASRSFPVPAPRSDVLLLGGAGALVVLALPLAMSEGSDELLDVTSLGAFVLIHAGPVGCCVAASAWLPQRLRSAVLASCAVAAACSGSGLITDLSLGHGRAALSNTN